MWATRAAAAAKTDYRVDPDGVLGIIAGLDDLGGDFESAHTQTDLAATGGKAALTKDGRTTVANAWQAFMEDRRDVPGAIMHSISTSARAIGEATVIIVAGDDQMAADMIAANFGGGGLL